MIPGHASAHIIGIASNFTKDPVFGRPKTERDFTKGAGAAAPAEAAGATEKNPFVVKRTFTDYDEAARALHTLGEQNPGYYRVTINDQSKVVWAGQKP